MSHEDISEENIKENGPEVLGGVAASDIAPEQVDSGRAHAMADDSNELRSEAAKYRNGQNKYSERIDEAKEAAKLFDEAKTEQEKIEASSRAFYAALRLSLGEGEPYSFNDEDIVTTQLIYQLFDMEGHADHTEAYITATLDKDSDLTQDSWRDGQGKIASVNKLFDHIKRLYGETGQYKRDGQVLDDRLNTENSKEELVEKAVWKFKDGIDSSVIDDARQKLRKLLDKTIEEYTGDPSLNEKELSIDGQADKVEEWAGILHDHPVSQSYKDAHPEVSFTGLGLELITDYIAMLQEKIEKQKQKIDDFEKSDQWAHDLAKRTEKEDVADLLTKDSTTIGELKTHFKRPYEKGLEGLQLRVKTLSEVLEDVKSGKASEEALETIS